MNFSFFSSLHSFETPEDFELLDASLQPNSGLSPSLDVLTITSDLPALDLEGNFCNPRLLTLPPAPPSPKLQVKIVELPAPEPVTAEKKIGGLTYEERLIRLNRYREKRGRRVWRRRVSYQCRKKVADNRIRIKGRFVTKEDALKILGRSNSVGL